MNSSVSLNLSVTLKRVRNDAFQFEIEGGKMPIAINANGKHTFKIARPFLTKRASSPKDYLDAALEVEKTISRHAVESDDEIFWRDNPTDKIDVSFGYGSAGVAYFYTQLYEITKEKRHAEIVRKAVNFIAANWRSIIPPEPQKYTWPDGMHFGIYGGLGGVGSFLVIAKKVFGLEKADTAISEILEYFLSKSRKTEDGITWTGSPVLLADGGILLFLTHLYEANPTDKLKSLLEEAGNAFLSLGIKHDINGKAALEFSDFETARLAEPDYPYEVSQPNFELGSAGAGFVLLRLFKTLGEEKYLSAAKKVEIYLDSIKVNQKKGFLIPYRIGEHEEIFFYLGNCHGAAGTAKFYYLLYKSTGDEQYLQKVHALFDGFESLGAPQAMSKGFWNNTSVCCGHGGVVNTTVGLFEATGEKRWDELAKKSAEILLGEKDEIAPGFVSWPIAYRRVAPTEFSYTVFYNDGTAGSAAALLRMYLAETGVKNPNSFADDPFGEN